MSPEPQRPAPAEREELARLLPVPAERDLPGRRHRLLKDHLMREIRQHTDATPDASPDAAPAPPAASRPRFRRRLAFAAVPLAAGAVAVTLAGGGVLGDQPAGTRPPSAGSTGTTGTTGTASAAVLLDRVATAAAAKPAPSVRDDQYIHITSKVAWAEVSETDMTLQKLHERQIWLPVDDSRPGLLRENGEDIELDDSGMQTEAGGHVPDLPPSMANPTFRYLESLPADPDVLLEKIYADTEGQGDNPDQEAFDTIGSLLGEQLVPPKVSAALYRAAAEIPGVTVVENAEDAVGRPGVAVAHTHRGERTEWIFDEKTLEYLGERGVMVEDTPYAKAGEVTATTAVLSRTVVDEPGQTTPAR